MKLLFVFTGGTIGSTAGKLYISSDSRKPHMLLEEYQRMYGTVGDYDMLQPYTILSENSTGETFARLIREVASRLSADYDGIIITHGTDTLQYSAALGYAFGNHCIPICMVSANHPIEHPDSNGMDNLHAAVRFIAEGRGRGVFVSYRNVGETTKIHRATRLIRSDAYSDRNDSAMDRYVGEFDRDWAYRPNPAYCELPDQLSPLTDISLGAEARGIAVIEPYPGMIYPQLSDKVRWILHGSYHSGTINTTSAEAASFFEEAHERGIPVFLTGIFHGMSYESTAAYRAFHLIPLYGLSPLAAYVKLWMLTAAGKDPLEGMMRSLGGDLFEAKNG